MSRTGFTFGMLFVGLTYCSFAVAQPAGLLEQAIEEDQARKNAQKPGGKDLVAAADRFVEESFRAIRNDIVAAKRALQAGDRDASRARVGHAKRLLKSLPKYVDSSVYRNQIRALERKIGRKTGRTARGDIAGPPSRAKRRAETLSLTEQGNETGPASTETQITETGEIVDVEALIDDDHQQHVYDRDIAAALRQNRVNWILTANEAAIAPFTDSLTYPADWPQRVAKRTKYRDGVIFEGQPFTGDDGQTYFTAIYDLGDLVHPIPNFYAAYPGSSREQRQQDLDRAALRDRSQIFNGYAHDLAAGLPLLHFFGGIDHNAISTRTDPIEAARITRIIETFVNGRSAADPGN